MSEPSKNVWSRVALIFAGGCSAALSLVSSTWSFAPTDWATLDHNGVYIPPPIPFAPTSILVQIALLIGLVVGLWIFACPGHIEQRTQRQRKFSDYVLLIAIMLLGFGLRIHTLGNLPLIIDEIGFAAHASDILHGQGIPLLAPGHNAMPITTSWLMAGAMALFGQTTFAARLVPLSFATLSIPAIYLLGRTWWSRRIGLIAAAFLATFPAHVHFSRFALNNLIDPLFAMLTLAFLARALRGGIRRYYVVTGIFAGLAQYFYQGGRLLLILVAVYWLVTWLRQRARLEALAHSRWIVLPIMLLSLPRFAPVLAAGLSISGNSRPIELPLDWQANALRSVLAWINQPDVSPFWLSDAKLLEVPALIVFVVGIVVAVRKWRDTRHLVVLVCLPLTTIFGGVIWASAPLYIRFLTAMPAISLLVALGIENLSRLRMHITLLPAANRSISRLVVRALIIGVISLQAVVSTIRHAGDAHARITDSQWQEDWFARAASRLPSEVVAIWVSSIRLDDTQRITIADYVAAFGHRRTVVINHEGIDSLEQQVSQLEQRYQVIRLP